MKEKEYQKPSIEIDELVMRTALLEVSGGYAKRTDYENGGTQDWDVDEGSNKSHIWDDYEE